jgi:ferredoxin-NADP reductase
VASFITRIESQRPVAAGTFEVRIAKPSEFNFRAGQFAVLGVIDPPVRDWGGRFRRLSLLSAPFESDLTFGVRTSDSVFKRVLSTAVAGTPIELKGPAGEFRLHEDATRPAVFLAGGIGVVPFISMLRQAKHDRAPHSFYALYSNRQLRTTPYLHELQEMASEGVLNLKVIVTITGSFEPDWQGEKGRIDAAMLRRHLPANSRAIYYVAGPSRFVSGMLSTLTAIDVGETDVRLEDFGDF